MKKINIKSLIIGVFIGVLISSGVVYAVTLIDSKDVTYTPSNSNFNVNNVESALDKLYENNYEYIFEYFGYFTRSTTQYGFSHIKLANKTYNPIYLVYNSGAYNIDNDYITLTGSNHVISIKTKKDCIKLENGVSTNITAGTSISSNAFYDMPTFLLLFK